MGLLGRFLGARGSSDRAQAPDVSDDTCEDCGAELAAEDDTWCQDCLDDYSGPKYCCGAIYEDGEDACRSCGEPI